MADRKTVKTGDIMARIKTDVGSWKKITTKDFQKIQLRVGTIRKVRQHPKLSQCYVLLVDTAAADEDLQVVAALKDSYKMQELLGKQVAVVCNIQPELIGGEENDGMLLASRKGKKPVLLTTDKKCPEGAAAGGITNGEFFFKE